MTRPFRVAAIALLSAGCTSLLGIDGQYVVGDASVPDIVDAASEDDTTRTDAPPLEAAADGSESGGDANGDSADDGGKDGPNDVVAQDGDSACQGHYCQGVCLPGTSCASCATAGIFCAATRTCVSGCTGCPGNSVECFTCPDGSASSVVGTCEPVLGAYCLGGAYVRCPCGSASECPGALQVCKATACDSCGIAGSDGLRCKNNLSCQESARICN